MQKLVTCLGFDSRAEEAVNFYTAVVRNSRVVSTSRYGEGGRMPKGTLLAATFVLDGQEFMALNGGPPFKFSIGTSVVIKCDTQHEIDELWDKLSEGGEKVQCGWLTDKFGMSWQIVPAVLGQLINDPNPAKSQAVMNALLQMKKLEIDRLKEAHAQA
jgi:predicted 3-demethylubiquinone-9 3-methyltransferase (glyoxalase superfamily)